MHLCERKQVLWRSGNPFDVLVLGAAGVSAAIPSQR